VLNSLKTVTQAGGKLGIPGPYVIDDPGARDQAAKTGNLQGENVPSMPEAGSTGINKKPRATPREPVPRQLCSRAATTRPLTGHCPVVKT
jgi:hypothetical protein